MALKAKTYFENDRGHLGFIHSLDNNGFANVEWEHHQGLFLYDIEDLKKSGSSPTSRTFPLRQTPQPAKGLGALNQPGLNEQEAASLAAYLARENPKSTTFERFLTKDRIGNLNMNMEPAHQCSWKVYQGIWERYEYCVICNQKKEEKK